MPIEMTSRTLVERLYQELREKNELIGQHQLKPKLGIVLVGQDPNSLTYIGMKQREAEKLGIGFSLHRLDETADEAAVLGVIDDLNNEPSITGIIVQLPLPELFNTNKILQSVSLEKDVDGLRPGSQFIPPTVLAITALLQGYDIPLTDKTIVVVGKGRLVGGPLIKRFKEQGIAITACDASTGDLAACTIQADILVSGTGEYHLIKPAMVKEGAVIIDVDHEVDYEAVLDKVSYITPQKGGVGPLTVAFLLANVIEATENHLPKES